MSIIFQNPRSPYLGGECRGYRILGPVSCDNIRHFGKRKNSTLGTPSGTKHIIHKFGRLEIKCISGESEIEVGYNPEKKSYSSEHIDALLTTRFN